jgi:hypothetical protein
MKKPQNPPKKRPEMQRDRPVWPYIFADPSKMGALSNRDICRDCMTGWGLLRLGHNPPATFPLVLAIAADRLGMALFPTGENLWKHSYEKGWE